MIKENIPPEKSLLKMLALEILIDPKTYIYRFPLGVEIDELIEAIVVAAKPRLEPLKFIRRMLTGMKKQKITVTVVDCQRIAKFRNLDYLSSELLILIANLACQNKRMEDFLPTNNGSLDRDLSKKTYVLLQNLKKKLKLSKQLLLVKNLDTLDERMREQIEIVLKNLSGPTTCSTVILGQENHKLDKTPSYTL